MAADPGDLWCFRFEAAYLWLACAAPVSIHQRGSTTETGIDTFARRYNAPTPSIPMELLALTPATLAQSVVILRAGADTAARMRVAARTPHAWRRQHAALRHPVDILAAGTVAQTDLGPARRAFERRPGGSATNLVAAWDTISPHSLRGAPGCSGGKL